MYLIGLEDAVGWEWEIGVDMVMGEMGINLEQWVTVP
jgi:hypothetical protein